MHPSSVPMHCLVAPKKGGKGVECIRSLAGGVSDPATLESSYPKDPAVLKILRRSHLLSPW